MGPYGPSKGLEEEPKLPGRLEMIEDSVERRPTNGVDSRRGYQDRYIYQHQITNQTKSSSPCMRTDRKQQGKPAPPLSLCRLPRQHATLQTLYEHLEPPTPKRSNHTNARHARRSTPGCPPRLHNSNRPHSNLNNKQIKPSAVEDLKCAYDTNSVQPQQNNHSSSQMVT